MALNRYFQRGQSGYVSQYTPYKLPFELWQRQLGQAEQEIDLAKQQVLGYSDTESLGLKELTIPESSRGYYGDAITQEFNNLQVEDYNKSVLSKNNIDQKINTILNEDFIMKVGTGEVSTELLKLNKEYKNHLQLNQVLQARQNWKIEADKELAKHGDDLTLAPWLATSYDLELKKMQADSTYVPTSPPIIGKALDRSSLLLTEVNRLKDEGYRSEDLQEGELYKKWSKRTGRSGKDYEAFALSILDNQNSNIRRDIEAQVDAHIRAGLLDESQRQAAIDFEIDQLVESTKHLEHFTRESGYDAKSQYTHEQEQQTGEGVPSTFDINEYAPGVSLNKLNQDIKAYDTQIGSLEKELVDMKSKGLDMNNSVYNKKYNQWLDLRRERDQLKANSILGEQEARYKVNYGERNSLIQQREIVAFGISNPELMNKILIQDENGKLVFDKKTWDQYAPSTGLDINTLRSYEAILTEGAGTPLGMQIYKGSQESSVLLNAYNNAPKLIGNNAVEEYNSKGYITSDSFSESEGKKTLLTMGYSDEFIDTLDKDDMATYITKGFKGGEQAYNFISSTSNQRVELERDYDDAKNIPVSQNPYDYYTTGSIDVPSISAEDINLAVQGMDVTNSFITLSNGTKIEDPILLERIGVSLQSDNKDRTGTILNDGSIVLKTGISQFDVMTGKDFELYLEQNNIDKDDLDEVTKTKKYLSEQPFTGTITISAPSMNNSNKQNAVVGVLGNENLSNVEKANSINSYYRNNSYYLEEITDRNSQLILASSGNEVDASRVGYNSYSTTADNNFFYQPNGQMTWVRVNGNQVEENTLIINDVELNYIDNSGAPSYKYNYTIISPTEGEITNELTVGSPNAETFIQALNSQYH